MELTLISGVLVLCSLASGHSPCPDIFEYKYDDGGGVYGLIHLRPWSSGAVSSLQLRTNFTIAARLFSNYVGRIEPNGDNLQLLQNYNRGYPIDYTVHFPVTSPLPKLTALSVNNNILCYGQGDVPTPHQYVTTTSLQHTLFIKGQGSPGFFNDFDSRPQSKPNLNADEILNYFGEGPEDAQVFTFGDDGDRISSWNTIDNRPYFVVNKTRPEYEPAVTRPHQHYQEPQYYPDVPEVMTRPPRPPPPPPRPVTTFQPMPSRLPAPPAATAPTSSESLQCGVIAGGNERQPLIYNGQSYPRGDWPWLTAIYKRKDGSLTFICSGTLVSDRHVVTAHCMQQKNTYSSMKDIVVKVGVYNLEDWGDDITVTRTLAAATIHESYNATSLANDILVLTFERSVQFNTNIRSACLWTGNPDLSRIVGASGVVAGWGRSETGAAGRGEPRVVRMPVVSTAVCRASRPDFHKLTSSNTLCAGDRNGAGPCLGDSGGGLYILEGGRWQLRGVVSLSLRPDSGDSTCNLNEYIVFTDSAKYHNWIRSTMAKY